MKLRNSVLLFLPLILASACNYHELKNANGVDLKASDLNSFNLLYSNLIEPECVRCHSGSSAAARVDLSSYNAMISDRGLIVPGNPNGSLLYQVVKDGSMPKGGPPFSPGALEAIANWILAGAPDSTFTVSNPATPTPPAPGTPPPVTTPPVTTPTPPSAITFATVQSQVLNPYCVRCHSGAGPSAGIDLSSYNAIMRISKLVVPKSAVKSLLYKVIIQGAMPPRGAVASADLNLLRDWINQGAVR